MNVRIRVLAAIFKGLNLRKKIIPRKIMDDTIIFFFNNPISKAVITNRREIGIKIWKTCKKPILIKNMFSGSEMANSKK